ncbi:MAG: FHA domain-containing protein [Deltaproteobacteria bacterium]|nr:FHA domain-containing protein [Deltaproteobacteria bacterium]
MTISMKLSTDFEIIKNEASILHVLAEVRTEKVEGPRPPMCVVLALDVSPSMSGEPLRQVVRSAEKLLELLGPGDSVGVVSFADKALVLADPVPVTGLNRRRLVDVLRRMSTEGGSTNLEAGLTVAGRLLKRGLVILLSDGQPNRGVCEPEGLGRLALRMRPHVSVSTLGFGEHHDERSLVAIATAGSGRYGFIRDAALCKGELAAALGAAADVVGQSVTLDLEPAEGVELLDVLGAEVDAGSFTHRIKGILGFGIEQTRLPDLSADGVLRVTIRVRVRPRALGACSVLGLRLAYSDAATGRRRVVAESAKVEVQKDPGPLIAKVARAVILAKAERDRQDAMALVESGRSPDAASLLRATLETIRAAPEFVANDGSNLAELHEQLIDDVALFEQCPDELALRAFRRGQRLEVGGDLGAGAGVTTPFEAAARGPAPVAALIEPSSGDRYSLGSRTRHVVGRSRTCDLHIPSSQVSRQHAALVAQDGAWFVEDYGSANGVLVDGRKVSAERLVDGAVISFGERQYRIEYARRAE